MTKDTNQSKLTLNKFKEVYDLYYIPLCKFVLFYTKDKQLIEDTVQDVFLSLWENRDNFNAIHTKTFLFQCVKNRLFNKFRDEKNRSRLLENWFQSVIEDTILEDDKYEAEKVLNIINKAIESLPKKCREIFILHKIKNLSYKQIAEIMQVSEKTVGNQMGIALKKIRNYTRENQFLALSIISPFIF